MTQETENSAHSLTVVYSHNSVTDIDLTLKAAGPILGKEFDRDSIRFLSSWGSYLRPTVEYRPCGHYLSLLDSSIKRAVVLRNTISIPSSKSLAVVFGTMLSRMGEGSEIFIQSPKASKASNTWVTSEQLRGYLPSCTVADESGKKKGWIRVEWGAGVTDDIDNLGSIYPKIVSKLDEFAHALSLSDHPCADPLNDFTNSVEGSFAYSMHWALHTRGAFETILDMYMKAGSMRILDIGGSYGFLACELATNGHHVTNLELMKYRIDQVFPWLIEASGVAGRVDGIAKRMEELSGADASFDVICFMGSLLCIDRDDVAGVLDRASRLLKPGGLIILRENMLLPENATTHGGHEDRFTAAELHEHLQTVNPDVKYMCHQGQFRTFEEAKGLWTLFAAVEKQPECASVDAQHQGCVPSEK